VLDGHSRTQAAEFCGMDGQTPRDGGHRRSAPQSAERAIESGVADPTDPSLTGRLAELKRMRDSARADVEWAEARDAGDGPTIAPDIRRPFAAEARKRLKDREGGFRRRYVQARAQGVEVASEDACIHWSTEI
jgi:site-specific DNA recombinase